MVYDFASVHDPAGRNDRPPIIPPKTPSRTFSMESIAGKDMRFHRQPSNGEGDRRKLSEQFRKDPCKQAEKKPQYAETELHFHRAIDEHQQSDSRSRLERRNRLHRGYNVQPVILLIPCCFADAFILYCLSEFRLLDFRFFPDPADLRPSPRPFRSQNVRISPSPRNRGSGRTIMSIAPPRSGRRDVPLFKCRG